MRNISVVRKVNIYLKISDVENEENARSIFEECRKRGLSHDYDGVGMIVGPLYNEDAAVGFSVVINRILGNDNEISN